jgi:DNA mismatch endonuclease (patch repair protein)
MLSIATTSERALLMARVRQRGTLPELVVRKIVKDLGYRLSHNSSGLPGSPDLCDRLRKRAIFVHGCFWHRHPGCAASSTPKTNGRFWRVKFEQNVARDARNERALRRMGYGVMTIWECQVLGGPTRRRLISRIQRFLEGS